MPASLQSALCCWASQQSPVDDGHASLPASPSACTHACTCAHGTSEYCCQHGRRHGAANLDMVMAELPPSPPSASSTHNDSVLARIAKSSSSTSSPASSIRHLTPAAPAPAVTRKSSTTFVLTTPSAYNGSSITPSPASSSALATAAAATTTTTAGGKSPAKRFSLQKYYYTRNTMSKPSSSVAATTTLPSIPSSFSTAASSPSTSSFVKTGHTTATGPAPVPSFSGPRSSLYHASGTGSTTLPSITAPAVDVSTSPKLTPYPHPYHRSSSSSPKLSAHHRPSSELQQTSPPPSPLSIHPRLSRESRRSTNASVPSATGFTPPTLHIQRASMSSSIVDLGSATARTSTDINGNTMANNSNHSTSSLSSPWQQQIPSPPSPLSVSPHCPAPPMLLAQPDNVVGSNRNIDLREQRLPFGRTTTGDSILPSSLTTPELSIGVRLSLPPLAVTAPSPTSVFTCEQQEHPASATSASSTTPLQVPTLSLPGKKPSLPALQTSNAVGAKRSTSTTSVSTSYSVASSTTPTSTSSSPTVSANISSPLRSALVPYPASPITPQGLLDLMKNHATSTRGRPLVLDVRPHPEFYPLSIAHSININLPTLLLRRYRRGGAVSSFALESFITMPSDKDLYHAIQDEWRANNGRSNSDRNPEEENGNETTNSNATHDIVVLDHDMRAGDEEYGRAATPAWTLVSVLERGGGNLNGAIRLWYLQGGFEAFQAWNTDDRFLAQYGECMLDDPCTASDGAIALGLSAPVGPMMGGALVNTPLREEDEDGDPDSLPTAFPSHSQQQQDVEMKEAGPMVDANTAKIVARAVSMSGAAMPRQRNTSGAPARRESLFSLNTKSLPRPAGLARAQTIGVSPLNIKTTNLQAPPLPKANWLTVPNGINTNNISSSNTSMYNTSNNASPNAPSSAMSLGNASMEISHSATLSDHWSASSSSLPGSGADQPPSTLARSLTTKTSVSSLATLASYGGGSHYGNSHYNHHSGSDRIDEQVEEEDAASDTTKHRRGYFDHHHDDSNMAYYEQYGDDVEGAENDGEQEVSCILPNFLFLGPEVATEMQAQELERLGIKRVLNLARECEDAPVASRPGMAYFKIGLQDHIEADVSAGLSQAVDIIASSPDLPIYVHCKAGKSRSVTATIAYMISHLRWPLKKSYDHVLERRRCMCPNIGFVAELMRIEERTLGSQQERAGGNGNGGDLVRAGSLNSILSLSTSTGSPRMLTHKSSTMTMKSSFGSAVAEMGFHHPHQSPPGGYQLSDKPMALQTDFAPFSANSKMMVDGERPATRFTFENLHQLPSVRAVATVGGGWMDEDDFRGGIRSAME